MRRRFIVTAVILVGINLACCALFMQFREPETGRVLELDRAWTDGEFSISSGAPLTYLADRPLHNWSTFHGGESTRVKLGVLLNAPSLLVSSGVVDRLRTESLARSHYHEASWLRARIFVVLSTIQWLLVAYIAQVARGWARSENTAPN